MVCLPVVVRGLGLGFITERVSAGLWNVLVIVAGCCCV